jgi:hypothetical protein
MAKATQMNNIIDIVLFKPNGMVGLDLQKRARRFSHYARRDAPIGRGGNRSIPGRLKKSIRVSGHRKLPNVGQTIRIGTFNVPYAVYVHKGTKPHKISPRSKRSLAFMPNQPKDMAYISKGTTKIIRRSVNHPGTKANQFLSDNVKWLYLK